LPACRTRRLAESYPELHAGNGLNDSFIEVLDRLDKVRLAKEEFHIIGIGDLDDS
jgi:hypothetical protein